MPLERVEGRKGPQVAAWGVHLRSLPGLQLRQIKVGSADVFEQGGYAVDVPFPGTFTAKRADFAVDLQVFGTSTALDTRLNWFIDTRFAGRGRRMTGSLGRRMTGFRVKPGMTRMLE